MRRTAQEGVFILLKVTKRHKEKQPEGRTELTKLKTKSTDNNDINLNIFLPLGNPCTFLLVKEKT